MSFREKFVKTEKESIGISIIFFVMLFLSILTRIVSVTGNVNYSLVLMLKILSVSFVGGRILGLLVHSIIAFASERISFDDKEAGGKSIIMLPISFIGIMLSFMPYFLAYFPGILAYDSYIQIGQIMEGAYNEHHPLFHTLIIRLCLEIGRRIFGNVNAGAAVYVLLQCSVLAAVIAYGIYSLNKRGYKIYSIVALILIMIFPFNGFMAVSVTKDIPFATFFLLSVLTMSEIMRDECIKKKIPELVLLFLSVFMCTVFRNNAKYAFALMIVVSIVVLAIVLIKNKKNKDNKTLTINFSSMLGVTAVALVTGLIALVIVSKALGAVQGDRREMLSVPIQQLARTYVYHAGVGVKEEDDNTMDDASKALINEFMLYDSAVLYKQDISDPVKRNTNTWVVVNKTDEFVKTYLGLFVKYPGDYINAFLALDAGFIDIGDESHAHVNDNPELVGMGYVQTRWSETLAEDGFYKDSKASGLYNILNGWADRNAYLKIPVLKYIFMPGIYLWIYVVFAYVSIKRRNIRAMVPVSVIAGYYLTMFFGPCVQLRYMYPVMIILPFILLLITRKEKKDA